MGLRSRRPAPRLPAPRPTRRHLAGATGGSREGSAPGSRQATSAPKGWALVEKGPDGHGPIAYVAFQSHANYYEPGDKVIRDLPGRFDVEDAVPGDCAELVRPNLDTIDETRGWAAWPGRWGWDRSRFKGVPGLRDAGNSPAAPCTTKAWKSPTAFHTDRELTKVAFGTELGPAPGPMVLAVERDGETITVDVELPPEAPRSLEMTDGDDEAVSTVTVAVIHPACRGPAFTRTVDRPPGVEQMSVAVEPVPFESDEVQVAVTQPNGRVAFSDS